MAESRLEPVIGLEIHVQLRTASKMFCGNAAAFGAPPNSNICPVCIGLPGALPVVNARAVELGVRAALGLGCTVHPRSSFARKSYFYPDLPKGYQITQHEEPLATGGFLEVRGRSGESVSRVRIRRLHLEEDTGKLLHDRLPGATAIDLNRAGVPLIEIVTEPDLRSPADARAILNRLKQALQYLEVSDCSMEQGSLRVDANVSVHRPGEPLGTRTEIKNLNSFSNLERALRFEIARQRKILMSRGRVEHLTLQWDAVHNQARPVRSKEEAHDYRYFPEPDLPPLVLPPELVESVRTELPEMPWERVARLERECDLPREHAEALSSVREVGNYFEAVVREGADPREAAKWIQGEVLALLNARGALIQSFAVRPRDLAGLLRILGAGAISRTAAKQVLARMAESGMPADRVVTELGLEPVRDPSRIESWIAEVLHAHPEEVGRYHDGDVRLFSFFIGEVMRLARGRADPRQVESQLRRRLGS